METLHVTLPPEGNELKNQKPTPAPETLETQSQSELVELVTIIEELKDDPEQLQAALDAFFEKHHPEMLN